MSSWSRAKLDDRIKYRRKSFWNERREVIESKVLMSKQYFVYILSNYSNTVLYTGITSNLIKRVWEHKQKLVKGFTEKYNVNKLVYFDIYDSPLKAIEREKQIKNLVRRKKIDLILSLNINWDDLSLNL